MENLYKNLCEILEIEQIKKEDRFENFEIWDSLSVLSIISMVDETYGIMISGNEIKDLVTVGDLEDLITMKREG